MPSMPKERAVKVRRPRAKKPAPAGVATDFPSDGAADKAPPEALFGDAYEVPTRPAAMLNMAVIALAFLLGLVVGVGMGLSMR